MSLYELDWPDRDELVETLYFPGTTVTLTGCDYYGCPEQTTDWVEMSSSTSSVAHVEAELRMTASATLEGTCGWNWAPNPVINTLSATPATIYAGGSSTLTWTTTNATVVSIPGTSGILAVDGSTTVSPTETTTYTVTATGESGTTPARDIITVTVNPVPVIDSFTADSTTIAADGSTTLRWTTTNATSVTISGVSGTLAVDGSVSVSPTAPTTYTLTAEGASGSTAVTATVTVTVTGRPTATLTADPAAITSGQSATLRWTTIGATSATIDQGVGAVTPVAGGSTSVSPTATTTYTLTAEGVSGTTPAITFIIVTVNPPDPVIDSFTASSTSVTAGTEVNLTWTTTNATSVSIPGTSGTLAVDGSTTVTPTETTTYTLTASDDDDTTVDATATVTITVTQPDPVIDSFTVDDSSAAVEESVTLSWTTSNADGVRLQVDQGGSFGFQDTGNALSADGSTTVSRSNAGSKEYRIRAYRGSTNAYSSSITITWTEPLPECEIDSFTASSTTITVGESTTLRWTTTGFTSVSISGISGTLAVDGSRSVSPTATATYTLTASGASCTTATDSVTIKVKPQIDSFRASPTTITRGDSTTLRWSTTGATSVSIPGTSGTLAVDGRTDVSPTRTTTYRLTATNSAGSNTRSVRVTVTQPPCRIDSFSASSTTITRGDSTTLRWSTTGVTSVSIPGTSGTLAVDGSQSVSPTTTTTYTLTISCPSGTLTRSVTIKVKPRIDSFSASSTTITRGESTTLRWGTTGATSVTISGVSGSLSVDGSRSVSPTSTTTYTLTASNAAGSNTKSVTVTVTLPPCEIDSFRADSTTITRGQSTTLRWRTTRATSTSINQGVGSVTPVASGSKSVSPTSTTNYTLTASGANCATATDSVTIKVKPRIDSFSASSTSITEGQSTTLNWTTTGATSVSISGVSGSLAVDGSRSVSPTSTTTYTLTAGNSAGSNTATVEVNVTQLPPTASLYADPEEIFNSGDAATLTWSTTRATSASIDQGVGSVTPVADGSVTVYPDTTTTYTLTASGPGGSATDTATVYTVDFQRALTATLTASSTSITRGESTTLSWTTEGATSASIDQGVGAVTPVAAGSRSVSPTETSTYTLTASDDDDNTATATVTITVTAP